MKRSYKKYMFAALLAVLILVAGANLPGMAQDTTTVTADSLTIVTGAVQFSATGDILVAGIIIAPAGAFNPSILKEGDLVIITGIMLNDTTLQAVTFEFFDDGGVEVTPEPTVEATSEVTPEATVEATAEVTPEATIEATAEVTPEMTPEATEDAGCNIPNHPVAQRIAETFNVSYEEVMAMHCAGNGFGNIIRAFALAEAADDGSTAQDFLDRHHSGEGWGQIMRDGGVQPSDLAPGQVMKHHDDTTTESTTTTGNGNGNGNGNGHGNGNGNGNGNGHGNGNGNGGGNGNGNGHGNGHG